MSAASPRPVVAAFDVDGTLTRRDCVTPFLVEVAGRRGLIRAIVRHLPTVLSAAVRRDRDRLKALIVGELFRDRPVDGVTALGEAFARRVLDGWMHADVLRRWREHRHLGHRTVLVSASLRPYLDPLGRLLDADAVLCTDVIADDGRYTGTLLGGNCRGAEKVARLDAWLTEAGLADAEVWAYGDSDGDRELLARAQHPWRRGRGALPALVAGARP